MILTTAELYHEQQRIKDQLLYLQHSPRNRAVILGEWLDCVLAPAYGRRTRTFVLEAAAQLIEVIPALTVAGCPPTFVTRIRDVLQRSSVVAPEFFSSEDIRRAQGRLVHLERSIHAWLGDAGRPDADPLPESNAAQERERLEEYITWLSSRDEGRASDYRRIADEWDAALHTAPDSVSIPLLEHDLTDGDIPGFIPFASTGHLHMHLRAVSGADTVRFLDTQQATPDTYDELQTALAAAHATLVQYVRHELSGGLLIEVSSSNGDLRLVGRSLGLGAAVGILAAWSEEFHTRHHVQLRAGVLITGRITRDGATVALDAEHVARKAELLHFSPYRALVLPKANEEVAQARLDALQTAHPRRRARLYPARELADVYNNRAVVDIRTRSVTERARRAARRQAAVLAIVSTMLLLCTVAAWYIFSVDTDANPYRITLMENEFVMWNKHGKELWRAPAGYPTKVARSGTTEETIVHIVDTMYARCVDLDGDGTNEVLASGYGLQRGRSEWFTCYNSDGTVRRKRDLFFGIKTEEGDYREDPVTITELWAGPLTRSGTMNILVDVGKNYFPHALTRMDTALHVQGKYIHIGAIRNYIVLPPRSGRSGKIVLAGQHNGFREAIVAVLDPDSIDGTCPQTASHALIWPVLRRNREDAYLVLPRSTLARVVGDDRIPYAIVANRSDSTITLRVYSVMIPDDAPSYRGEWAWLEVELDWSLKLIQLRTSSEYDSYKAYILKSVPWPPEDEKEEFLRGIRYWAGGKFVDYPTWRTLKPGYRIQ